MPERLFNLRGVPDDELEEVRELLKAQGIDHYETPGGNWGVSSPAIWVRESGDRERAQGLLKAYQEQRAARSREDWERCRHSGRAETLVGRARRDPWRMLFFVAVIALVLYVSIKPFLML